MKILIHKYAEDRYTFASEMKNQVGIIGDAPTLEEAKIKAKEQYLVVCIFKSYLNFADKIKANPDYTPQKEDAVLPEEIEFIIQDV